MPGHVPFIYFWGVLLLAGKVQSNFCAVVKNNRMARLRLSRLLMITTIVLVAAFQYYWISKLYIEERDGLKKQAGVAFRDVVYKLQLQRFRNDSSVFKGKNSLPDNLFLVDVVDSLQTKLMDSLIRPKLKEKTFKNITISVSRQDTLLSADSIPQKIAAMQPQPLASEFGAETHIIKYFSNNRKLSDSLSTFKLDSAFKQELLRSNINTPYLIVAVTKVSDTAKTAPGQLQTDITYVGLAHTYGYVAVFTRPLAYLLGRIKLPILVSLLLLAFTAASFVFLYRNLAAQQKLTAIKNEFIGNITHELKTPIATVTVAIEALRNFDALQNPVRTKEYLDISALELQRLSMLVDKVLKLSMFENKEIELKKETFDLLQLSAEVIAGMKLQFEKAKANIQLTHNGDDFLLKADRLHLTSVLYNLLDNALKYSSATPFITVHLYHEGPLIAVSVTDNGIGIPNAYVDKIFQKFFRVPSGDHHNIKGYGLGLSYVNHIVTSHNGSISVTSTQGKGSTFTVKLPKA